MIWIVGYTTVCPVAQPELDWPEARLCLVESEVAPEGADLRYVNPDRPIDFVATTAPDEPVWAPPADLDGTAECPDLWELDLLQASTLPVDGTNAPYVAVIDSGFLQSHQDFGRVTGQYDYGNSDTTPEVEWNIGVPGHGTFIQGMIAAPDNGVGRQGLAPKAGMNLQKIVDDNGYSYWSYAIRALYDLADGDLGVRVASYSWASSSSDSGFEDAVDALGDMDILFVVAAANCGYANCSDANNDDYPLYPANLAGKHIVTVAGSTQADALNTWSHYGPTTVDLAAPGVSLCSAGVNSDDEWYSAAGTSYATPLVAAAAALIFEQHPDLSAIEVARILRASAQDTADLADKVISGGRLDVHAGLATAVPRLEAPVQSVSFQSLTTLGFDLENVGAEGTAHLVVLHGGSVHVMPPEGWSIERFESGDTVTLPDAGDWTATQPGAVLTKVLAEHASETVGLGLIGAYVGDDTLSLRVALSSEGADYLNAPYDTGVRDETGFLAYQVEVDVQAVGEWNDTGDTGPVGDDTGPIGDDTGVPEPPGGCACGTGPAPQAGWAALVLLGAALLRRRQR